MPLVGEQGLGRHVLTVLLLLACISVWSFVFLHSSRTLDWRVLGVLAFGIFECVRGRRAERRSKRAIREARRSAGLAAAIRLEALEHPWDDRRMDLLVSELEAAEGAEAASRLRDEIAQARATTPRLCRPVRAPSEILLAFALFAVVFGLVVFAAPR
jgi:hypothetical protein